MGCFQEMRPQLHHCSSEPPQFPPTWGSHLALTSSDLLTLVKSSRSNHLPSLFPDQSGACSNSSSDSKRSSKLLNVFKMGYLGNPVRK
ncbi:hypothetical protein scyTo_0024596, partial [Scyliorhinus torazame]|nr:hypothetical protein [Scyliorhinus torazame]